MHYHCICMQNTNVQVIQKSNTGYPNIGWTTRATNVQQDALGSV